jgi:hypothetical protein
MLRNIFVCQVPSDLILLEDAQSIQIKKNLVHWQYATLRSVDYVRKSKERHPGKRHFNNLMAFVF